MTALGNRVVTVSRTFPSLSFLFDQRNQLRIVPIREFTCIVFHKWDTISNNCKNGVIKMGQSDIDSNKMVQVTPAYTSK